MRTPSKLAAQIVALLNEHGFTWPGGWENAAIMRTHAGVHQRSRGAWSWYLAPLEETGASYPAVGSQWPAREVVRGRMKPAEDHYYGDIAFDPLPKRRGT